jgi:hypothetical protein
MAVIQSETGSHSSFCLSDINCFIGTVPNEGVAGGTGICVDILSHREQIVIGC